jgi:hypothetical protein
LLLYDNIRVGKDDFITITIGNLLDIRNQLLETLNSFTYLVLLFFSTQENKLGISLSSTAFSLDEGFNVEDFVNTDN